MHIIWCIVRKEFQQIARDKTMLRIIFVLPILQLIVLGNVVTNDVRNLPIAILDWNNSVESRELIQKMLVSGYFYLAFQPRSTQEILSALDQGDIKLGITIPIDFSSDLARGETTTLQLLIDGTDSNSARVATGYISAIVQEFSLSALSERVIAKPEILLDVKKTELRSVVFYNPDLESRNYMIPGIMAILITMLTSILTSMGIVREKEMGTLEQIMVTPIKSYQLMLGKTIPSLIMCFFVMIVSLVVAKLYFKIPIEGSIPLFFGFIFLFLFTTLGLGLLISTISQTQQQALFFTWFINIFAIITSGFFIPIHNMPWFMQYLTYLNPVRYFMAIVRDLFLKGSTIDTLWRDAVILFIFGIVILAVSAKRFRKRVT